MNIIGILDSDCIRIPLQATDKTAAIAEMVDVLAEAKKLVDRDAVLKAILAREQTRSTGIGCGLAVPHGKSEGCTALTMAVGKPSTPIDFSSPDGQPVEFIALLASPYDKTGPHIQALASVSRLWLAAGFREAVAMATDPESMLTTIRRFEG